MTVMADSNKVPQDINFIQNYNKTLGQIPNTCLSIIS